MTADALDCLVCGRRLRNAMSDAENQPEGGIYLKSYGNYGSEVFDPENGEYVEFALCDECLVRAGAQGRVLSARDKRPVDTDWLPGVGWEYLAPCPVPWRKGLAGYTDHCYLSSMDLSLPLPSSVHLSMPVEQILEHQRAQDEQERREGEGKTRP